MVQLYAFLVTGIPATRIISYQEFVTSGQKAKIKLYILDLLKRSSEPLTNRDIHNASGIEIGSLTSPLLTLTKQNKIIRVGEKKNKKSRRIAITYSLAINQN